MYSLPFIPPETSYTDLIGQFFILLWEELQTRASGDPNTDEGITATLSYEDIKGRTSSSVGQGTDDGALFDETIAAYALRGKAAQELLSAALVESHNKAFRDYVTKVHWTTIGEAAELGKSFCRSIRCDLVLTCE